MNTPLEVESPDLASADLVPGLPFGDYVLVAPLGRGAQSVVWEARPVAGGEPVALKLLSSRLSWNAAWRERFRREAELGARLRHPHLVPVLGAGEARGRPFLAQQLVPGGRTLADDIAAARRATRPEGGPRRRLPREHFLDAAALFARVADALHVAHEAGVLHRDVKPGNILVQPDGQPLLADFGCSGPPGGDGECLDLTPCYASPEQMTGAPLDRRSDVFSLGATLHEALTLDRAFDGGSASEVRAAVRACRPADPCALQPGLPRDLAHVVARCLQAEPARRYATAGELARDLRRHLHGWPVSAGGGGALRRAARWLRPTVLRAAASSLVA